jgi:hypothetical protein
MYQVGQAVIYRQNDRKPIFYKTEDGWELFNGVKPGLMDDGVHAQLATEAEILAEAVKHGWVEKINIESPFDYFELSKKDKWEWISFPPTLQENLKEYCEDGLIAHRLITALNLAK